MYFKEFRNYLDIPQKNFAEKLGIAPSALARYESLKITPNISLVQKYIEIFNASPNFLFLGQKPVTLDDTPQLDEKNIDLVNDLSLMFNHDELYNEFYEIIKDKLNSSINTDKLRNRDRTYGTNITNRFLIILTFVDSVRIRPFLFMYHIFNSLNKQLIDYKQKMMTLKENNYQVLTNSNHITLSKITSLNYQDADNLDVMTDEKYMDLLKLHEPDYKKYLIDTIISYKPSTNSKQIFNEKMRNEISSYIGLDFTHEECKNIFELSGTILDKIERNMLPSIKLKLRKNY